LIEKVLKDIKAHQLKADTIIQELFSLAKQVKTDGDIYERAHMRLEIGNPPGKRGSLGDALNWEALLQSVPDGEDLYFISDDKDFASPIDRDAFNAFLLDEWAKIKNSNLVFYRNLSAFFKEHFPNISLASELEKDILIRKLANSGSFAETHEIIAKLNKYTEFTIAQINAIVEATISNNQVYWIIGDSDIKGFLLNVIKGKEDQIDPENLDLLMQLLNSCVRKEEK